MRYSLASSFSKHVFVLFFAVIALTVAGRIVTLTDAEAFCMGWPLCTPTAPRDG
jgi:heme A synthase